MESVGNCIMVAVFQLQLVFLGFEHFRTVYCVGRRKYLPLFLLKGKVMRNGTSSRPEVFKVGGGPPQRGSKQWMKWKNITLVITLVIKRRSHNHNPKPFGEFYCFSHIQSETNDCLRTALFLCIWCSLKLCQTAILAYLDSVVECLWNQVTSWSHRHPGMDRN